ncbi:MAG: hypothetical protein V8T51_01160 [Senegalimassilia faecalis]
MYGLSGFNLEISERVPIEIAPQEHDRRYLQTKAHRMGHLLDATGKTSLHADVVRV